MTVDELYNNIVKLTPYKSDKDIEFREVLSEALKRYQRIVKSVINSNIIGMNKDAYDDIANSGLYEARLSGDMEPPIVLAKLILFS